MSGADSRLPLSVQGLFVHALNSARESAPAAVAGADEGGVCLASLGLLAAILSWDFSRAGECGRGAK